MKHPSIFSFYWVVPKGDILFPNIIKIRENDVTVPLLANYINV